MKRSLLAYNGLGTVFAIVLWYGLMWVSLDPAIFFAGSVAGILFGAALAVKTDEWFWLPLVLAVVAIVCFVAAQFVVGVDALHMFLVCGTLFLTIPINARVLGSQDLDFKKMIPGVPAFMAFIWFVNLGVWWGIGSAFLMFAVQAITLYGRHRMETAKFVRPSSKRRAF